MTWLDMEKIAYVGGFIDSRSAAASIGGMDDNGEQLSERGVDLIVKNIEKNQIIAVGRKINPRINGQVGGKLVIDKGTENNKPVFTVGIHIFNMRIVWRVLIISPFFTLKLIFTGNKMETRDDPE